MIGYADRFIQAVKDERVGVFVIGLGYVGLPLAVAFARAGLSVVGVDSDPAKVKAIRAGRSYLSTVKDTAVAEQVQAGRLTAVLEIPGEQPAATRSPCAFIVCMPTPLTPNREPDLRFVRTAFRDVAGRVRENDLVVLESTTYPGTTREMADELFQGTGALLAYSPEREDPGNQKFALKNTTKLVGGLDEQSALAAQALYLKVCDECVTVKSPEVAECAKLFENIYRAVNVALVNELKVVCEAGGLNVWDVLAAAATKPFGFQRFDPGPGLGGHCFALGTLVMTADGWREIETIEPGMQVLTEHGEFRPVERCFKHAYSGLVRWICTGKGMGVYVTPEHGIYVYERGREIVKKPAAEVKTGMTTIWPHARRFGFEADFIPFKVTQARNAGSYSGNVYNLQIADTRKYVTPIGMVSNCLPLDPFYLASWARKHGSSSRFIELAGEINSAMPGRVADRVQQALNSRGKPVRDSSVLVIGIAYKANVDDTRESPAMAIMDILAARGARLMYHDPHVPVLRPTKRFGRGFKGHESVRLDAQILRAVDCVLIVTAHQAIDWNLVGAEAELIVDTRDVMASRDGVVQA